MLAIGRLYDERLEFFGINLSIILSITFLVFSIPLLLSIKNIVIYSTKRFFYYFLLILIILPPILFLYFDYEDLGLMATALHLNNQIYHASNRKRKNITAQLDSQTIGHHDYPN